MSPDEFERRASTLLGGYGWQAKWAVAAGLSRQHVSRTVNGKAPVPLTWVAILELLDAVEVDRLPLRWQSDRSPRPTPSPTQHRSAPAFDRVAYQREYMRARRVAERAAKTVDPA